jgi:hypothetical protein
MNRALPAILAAALPLAGCAFDDPDLGEETAELVTRCPSWGCGSNGVIVGDYPVEALHLDGLANRYGFRLVALDPATGEVVEGPPTLQWGSRGAIIRSAQFDVWAGELVELQSGQPMPIGDSEIHGAWFVIERRGEEWTVHVSKIATVPSWAEGASPVPVYDLRLESNEGPYLCPEAMAWGDDYQKYTGPGEAGNRPVEPWQNEGYFAMLIRGETYDGTDATVSLTGQSGERWLNIACSGTALSKMRLLGYDPELDPQQPGGTLAAQRQATLKMITAKYCGAKSYTVAGTPLWYENRRVNIAPAPQPSRIGPIEARWDRDGATCLSHARTYRQRAPLYFEDRYLATVRDECRALGHHLEECARGAADSHEWESITLDHVH